MERTKYTPKRLLSLLLALIMLLGMLPTTTALAAVTETQVNTVSTAVEINQSSSETSAYYHQSTSDRAVAQDGDIIFLPAVTVASYNVAKDASLTAGATFDLALSFVVKNTGTSDYDMNSASEDYGVKVEQVDANGQSMKLGSTSDDNGYLQKSVGNVKAGDTQASSGTLNWPIHAQEDGTIYLKYSFLKRDLGQHLMPLETFATVFVKVTGIGGKYKVTYDGNGGTLNAVASAENNSTINGTSYMIPADAAAEKEGYTFAGWYGGNPAESANWNPGQTIPVVSWDVHLTAQFEENFKITFDPGYFGAKGIPTSAMSTGKKFDASAITPTLDGYTFAGWEANLPGVTVNDNLITGIEANIILTALWTKDGTTPATTHSVKFVQQNEFDGSSPVWPNDLTGAKGEKVKIPWTTPTAEGKTFLGWSTTENATAAETVYERGKDVTLGDKDIILYAVWADKTVKITYPTSLTGGTVTKGLESVKPGTSVTFKVRIGASYDESTLKVTANGVELGAVSKTTSQNTEGKDIITLTYTFNPTVDTKILVSAPSKLSYTVTLPVSDKVDVNFTNTANKSATVEYGGNVTFKVEKRAGYTVKGVYANGQKLTADNGTTDTYTIKNITANQTVTVDVEAIVLRNVTYVLDGAQMATQQVESGAAFTLLSAPTKTGYTWDGKWYTDNTYEMQYTGATTDKDLLLYGRYTPKSYTISYNLNLSVGETPSVTISSTTKTYGQAVVLSTVVPTRTGYDFLGWAKDAASKTAVYTAGATMSEEITEDTTLYAVWAKKTYTITLQSGSGYTIGTTQATVVEHGGTFNFTVTVDGAYAAEVPIITISDEAHGKLQISGSGNSLHEPGVYTCTIKNVTADQIVSVQVKENERVNVAFVYRVVDADGNEMDVSGLSGETVMTQVVQIGDPATQPMQPSIEGYRFVRWSVAKDATTPGGGKTYEDYDFTKPVVSTMIIYAEITPIVPQITVVKVDDYANGWSTGLWKYGTTSMKPVYPLPSDNVPFKIAYGDNLTFALVVYKGYDYSKLSVSANGYALGYDSITANTDGSTTIQYYLGYITADTRISITGIERKTITINYFANAGDDVAQVPGPQTGVKYYIEGATNDTISSFEPKRNGYTFLGWCENPAPTGNHENDPATKKLTKIGNDKIYQPGNTAAFEKDTNLYAIWEAAELKVKLVITDEFVTSGDNTNHSSSISADHILEYAYEGDKIYLVGKLSENAQGTMTFYKRHRSSTVKWEDATDWTYVGSVTVNGGQYGVLETTAEPYEWGMAGESDTANNRFWVYKVEFVPTNEEGYTSCKGADDLRVYSKAISWALKAQNPQDTAWTLTTDANKLTVYEGSIAVANKVDSGVMVANKTYWLQIPQVFEMDGGMTLKQVKEGKTGRYVLIPGTDYTVQWEYQDEKGAWQEYGSRENSDSVKVTPELSGHVFRAKVYPADASIYTKAAKYNNTEVVKNQYEDWLETLPTEKTEREDTAIALEVNTDDEPNSVVINGGTPFIDKGFAQNDTHKAQYEYQTIDLVAKVTKTDTDKTAIGMGTVAFYRYVGKDSNDKDIWEEIGTVDVQPNGENTGVAVFTYEMPGYDEGTQTNPTPVTDNVETFKAVYLQNETYKTSESAKSEAYIKSAELQTPVIMDADKPTAHKGYWLNGETKVNGEDANKTETTYNYHLGGLMAGIPHTFELKKTAYADGATADYSVVARDGRAVPADMYTMKWETLTDANWKTTTTTGTTYTAETTKVGDRYHILLTGAKNSPFEGSEAVSKDIAIGDPQGVTVTVEAIDAIKATKVDRNNGKYPDVYQLNEITLTATVEAAEAGADRKPTGTVAFYYVDENKAFQPLGKADLKPDTSGKMVAKLTTDELPVETKTKANTKLDSVITAVYYGDETFKPSENWGPKNGSTTEWEVKATDITDKVKSDTVTVYSSVIFNCADENKKQASTDKGIHINVEDGVLKVNEKATLKLSDIYTLDRELGDDLLNIIAKLDPDTDYTVRWQKLNGATAIGDEEGTDFANSKRWTDIGATGTTLVLDQVEQDTAYRAVITVNDQPITKGSYTKVEQTVKGRQVYYSNVLMATDTNMTVSVALNTGKIGAENTEGITEGEIVTANVYLSGVVGAVPNANVTVTVTNDSSKGNGTAGDYKQVLGNKNTVNGWNAFDWDTTGVTPGFYTLTVSAKTNTGYAQNEITRSLIVRESTYDFKVGNTNPTYNGRTQGLTVTLKDFHFSGDAIDNAASKSWTVKYYDQQGKLVEPSQAGTYKAVVTLPASAYWTKQTQDFTFTIQPRKVSVEDAVAQAKVYDNSTTVNIVEVMLNDAETDQATTGWLKSGENTGIINGDSIYAVATKAALRDKNAGENKFDISEIELRGDDAANYVWNGTAYTEDIYVSRSQVYGEIGTLKLKQGEQFPTDQVIKMIDQAGNELKANEGYTLTFYYHSDTKIEKTEDLSKTGLYTVVARPNQDNYKGGVTMKFEVVKDAADAELTAAKAPKPSTLISISNTAELYGKSTGVTASTTNDAATTTIEYQSGSTGWTTTAPTSAGRYLVRVTASTGDVAYGIYTITKAHPELTITPADTTYNSMPQNGYSALTGNNGTEGVDWHITYAGDVAISFDVPEEGNVAEQAPVDAGDYVATLHVNETTNYTAHEVSTTFTIKKAPLTITADSWQTTQYDAFPDMTAKYEGLAAVDTDTTPDTSLRDVQIAPEYLYNPTNGKSNYNNDTLDQVGYVAIQPVDALSKNYDITYGNGQYTKQRDGASPDLAIHGLPQSGDRTVNRVYFGDVIQLYPYGYYTKLGNGSAILEWSVTKDSKFKGDVTIDKDKGILNVAGVGDFTVTLKRGVGEQQISTSVTVAAIQKEAKVALKNVDKVYTGASQTYAYEGNVTVHDELYQPIGNFVDSKLTRTNTARIDVGTQITTAKVTGAWAYQSETYGGKFTINDKEATVQPKGDSHIYGQTRTIPAPAFEASDDKAISLVQTASQTDAYNRLDVYDGYEILMAGTEDMNYNVKYITDQTAEDSAVTTYGGMKFTSKTTEELNDATVYGETPKVLNWTLERVIGTTRGTTETKDYADNLADFTLENIFVEQDKDDCKGNHVTYKAANRTTTTPATPEYNQAALAAKRTSVDEEMDENYTLKFKTVLNSGAANYRLTNNETGNATTTTTALTNGSKGFILATGETGIETGENFVEGSANIAQRPVTVKKASTIGTVSLYWRLPQSKLYTALLNILEAEENSTNRGLAKGHTIKDLDLEFAITTREDGQSYPVSKDDDRAINFAKSGAATVTVKVGDTNYVLDGTGVIEGIELKNIQIEATYTTKTATNFVVLIKVRNEDGRSTTALKRADGLTYKILRKVNGSFDGKVYASGSLTYTGRMATDKFGDECGVFTASYGPLSNIGGTYFIQMYEYGVALQTKNS